jgi:hypothetical protein
MRKTMPKSKHQRRLNRKAKLRIPNSVEQEVRMAGQDNIYGPDNARMIKARADQLEQEEIKELAEAIYDYMAEKRFEPSDQTGENDTLILQLSWIYKKSAIKKQTLFKKRTKMADLRVIYESLPISISASNDEIEQIKSTLREQRPIEQIDHNDIIAEIAKRRGVSLDLNILKKRNYLAEIERIVDDVIKKHDRSKLILFIEGIIIGLVGNGLFELLKRLLEQSIQIAGILHMLPQIEHQLTWDQKPEWKTLVKPTDGFSEEEAEIAYYYALHAMFLLAAVGPIVTGNPLFEEVPNELIN